MKKLSKLIIFLLLATPVFAASINDVSSSDGAYKAIENSVDEGYLPVDSEQNFNPNRSVTRRELAITIDKLIEESKKNNLSLTTAEIRELNSLSKSFKKNHSSTQSRLSKLELKTNNYDSEFKTVHTDITKTNDKLQSEVEDLKKQRKIMWIAIVVSGLLGLSN